MTRFCLTLLALPAAWMLMSTPASAQVQEKPRGQEKAAQDLTIRGKIVKMETPDRFVVKTSENKEIILQANPQTRFVINGKAGKYTDLRVGTEINAGYVLRDDRYLVNTVTIGAEPGGVIPASGAVQTGTTLRGKIVRLKGPDQVIVATTGGKEVMLVASPTTRYVINGKAARFADLRVGIDVGAVYAERDHRFLVETFTVGAEPQVVPAGDATLVEGTVVRVVGEDQVVVRTPEKREVIVYVGPTTKYLIDDQPARFADFRSGAEVRIQYDVIDRRNTARSIIGLRRNKK
jgi:hypothetical protein